MNVRLFTDMMGNEVELIYPPKRIISLVPSQTELLYDLGLNKEVAGITKFCVHPDEWFRNKTRVGGTKTVNLEIVKTLHPDLIIANKEENTRSQIEELSTQYPVWVSDIQTIDDSRQMILEVGALVGKAGEAQIVVQDIAKGFAALNKSARPKKVAYFIWRKPWMCAGGDTFISNMIAAIGWENALADRKRYPEIKLEELRDKQIDLVLLSSEPYPFKDGHIAEIRAVFPGVEVILVDGEMFSWYGSRLREAVKYFGDLSARW